MNCRLFERGAADWLSGRLSPNHAAAMDAHRAVCPACAQVARAEEALRECWRVHTSSAPAADLWPRLARKLEVPPRRVWTLGFSPRPQWAMAALFAAGLALGVGHWAEHAGNRASFGTKTMTTTSAAYPPFVKEAELQSHAAAWSALNTIAPEDPAVDDPVGANMETLWTSLRTDGK